MKILLREAKKRYYENELTKHQGDPKKQWNLLNNFLNESSGNSPISEIIYNNISLQQPTSIANAFSDFFSSIPTTQSGIPKCSVSRVASSFFLLPVTADEVCSVLLNLKNKCAGLDNISAYHLKLVARNISGILSDIINLMFQQGVFPKLLKKSKIVPVFKKDDKRTVSNYRPISILSSLSKVIEKLFVDRLSNYLSKFNILHPCQFGFRSGSSTSLALVSLLDYLKKSIDSGKFIGSVFLDFTKAFDTINHATLFNKLEAYGVTGAPLTFLKNYLHNREWSVYVSGASSETKLINQGVPQGSILGPLLFIIYINDLVDAIKSTHCVLYADDTTIIAAEDSLTALTLHLNNTFLDISKWCYENQLIINPAKTKFMIFRSAQRPLPFHQPLTLGPHSIPTCDTVIFLGVHLDCHLKFNLHTNHLRKKTSFGIRAIIKAREVFHINVLMSLYFAFIHSHIMYGIAAWGNTYDCHLSPIQNIQNQVIRIITNSSRYSSAGHLLQDNKILPVRKLFFYSIAVLLFQLRNALLPFEFIDSVFLQNNNVTRFAMNLNFLLPASRTNYGKMTTAYAAITFWNNMPLSVKTMPTLSSFKKSLKSFLLNY